MDSLISINNISSDQSNTVVFAVPLEVLDAIRGFTSRNGASCQNDSKSL
mgnify:CR=1